MPTIPNLIQDSQTLDTGTGRQRVQSDASAFGAQEASALAQVGQGLRSVAQVAADKDDEFTEAEARELDNELSRRIQDRLTSQESGYLTTARGRLAVDGRADVERELDEIAVEVGARASNPRAAALYRRAAQSRVLDGLGRVATHAARETESYYNEQAEARLLGFADDAAAAYGDEARVRELLEGADTEIGAIAKRRGWDEEVVANRQRQFRSDVMSRTIVLLSAEDPEAAEDLYQRVRPGLTAQEAAELQTTMRAVRRQAEDGVIDEAWAYVSEGRRIPAEVWSRVPGRARIDIQNEQRRRAEGGAGGGDPWLIAELQVMALEDPEQFAQADLRAVRSQLGPRAWATLSAAQTEIRNGSQDQTVNQQSETFNALVRTAETALAPYGVDITITEGMDDAERRRAIAFRAALQRELEAFGGRPTAEEAQVIIGRAVVSMRGADVAANPRNRREQGLRVEGRRDNERFAVRPPTGVEVVVPFDAIPNANGERDAFVANLQRQLGRMPMKGEVENAYAAFVSGRRIQIGGGE